MRALIYTRTAVRTGRDAIGRQAEQCRAFAVSHGWAVTGVFTDDGASGTNMNRPAFRRVTDGMRNRAFDVLITSTASVLTRRASDLESILAAADASGVAVVTADGIVDTSTELGVMTARIMTRFAGRWDEDREEETHASAD